MWLLRVAVVRPWLLVGMVAACAPAVPAPVPAPPEARPIRWAPAAAELRYLRLSGGRPDGHWTQRRGPDGTIVQQGFAADGTETVETSITVDAAGVPTALAVGEQGAPAEQLLASGADASGAYFLHTSWNELSLGLLARALGTAPGQRLPLLPSGEASLETSGERVVGGAAGAVRVTLFLVGGFDRLAVPIWLDARGDLFAASNGWDALVRDGYADALPELEQAQDTVTAAKRAALATLGRRPAALVIRNARVFDPITLRVTERSSVAIEAGRIRAVGPDAEVATPRGAEVLDADGRFLMPGLWENHAHLWNPSNPMLYVATGVTTVRELGNTAELPAWVARMDAGIEIGPRVLMALSVSRAGDMWWRANHHYVETVEEIQAFVDLAAEAGYVQVKLRDVKPELVPLLVEVAHARGLRVSGHVPRGLTPRMFAEAGVDEIQHLGSLISRGFFPTEPALDAAAKRDRFIAAIGPPVASEIRTEIELYAARGVAIDVTALQRSWAAQPSEVPEEYRHLLGKGPLEHERAIPRTADPAPVWAAAAGLLRELHRAGVVLLPGTEGVALAGYELIAELESWVKAGVPAAEVLQLATYGSARNMGLDHQLGTLAPGSHADLILVDGDPTRDITSLRRIHRVIKGGTIYDPVTLLRALGIER